MMDANKRSLQTFLEGDGFESNLGPVLKRQSIEQHRYHPAQSEQNFTTTSQPPYHDYPTATAYQYSDFQADHPQTQPYSDLSGIHKPPRTDKSIAGTYGGPHDNFGEATRSVNPYKGHRDNNHEQGNSRYDASEISGRPDSYEDGRGEPYMIRFLVPKDRAGVIIGKGGATIKRIREVTGTSIKINDSHGHLDRVVSILSHNEEGVREAFSHIMVILLDTHEYVDFDPDTMHERTKSVARQNVEARLLVSNSKVGGIIGRGGLIIKAIREETNTSIQILSSEEMPYGSRDRTVVIKGALEDVLKAEQSVGNRLKAIKDEDDSLATSGRRSRPGPPSSRPHERGPSRASYRDGPPRAASFRDAPARDAPYRDGPSRESYRDGPPRDSSYREGTYREPYRDAPYRDGHRESAYRDGSSREFSHRHGDQREDAYRDSVPRESRQPRHNPHENQRTHRDHPEHGRPPQYRDSESYPQGYTSFQPNIGAAPIPGQSANFNSFALLPQLLANPALLLPLSQPEQQEAVSVPEESVGRIVGKGGATVEDIKLKTGCRVEVHERDPNSSVRVITLVGTEQARNSAKYLIRTLL